MSRTPRSRTGFLFAVSSLSLFCLGCSQGSNVYPVSGKVLFSDGSPVDSGVIEFRSTTEGVNARARIQKDGSFRLTTIDKFDGAVLGEHQVIVQQQIVAESARPSLPSAPALKENPEFESHKGHRIVPSVFSRYETSPLSYTVEEQENYFEVEVSDREK